MARRLPIAAGARLPNAERITNVWRRLAAAFLLSFLASQSQQAAGRRSVAYPPHPHKTKSLTVSVRIAELLVQQAKQPQSRGSVGGCYR